MKKNIITLTIALISLSTALMAQPLPPTTPSGSPVPVAGSGLLILMGLGIYFVTNKRKNSK